MNWMGKKISKFISKSDTVLDLGCGIMQATTGIYDGKKSIKCKTIVGVELVDKYLDKVKPHYPTIKMDVTDAVWKFPDDSFDVVICIDVLEHLEMRDAVTVLKNMKRIARHTVIIYTPRNWDENGDNVGNAWGLGENPLQHHKSLVTEDVLHECGFATEITEIDGNVFGVFEK